ncbi:MAG: glycosyltransferase [Brevundimonas sp.]|nr:glycosyltransferase [Brevundimonas sp.]
MTAPQPRHILMTTDAVGGVWTYALDLAAGLITQGVSVTLAVLGPAPRPGQRRAAEQIAGLTVVETGLPLDWTAENPGEITEAARGVAAMAAARGADLVHLNTPALAAEARFSAPVVGACHSCLASWWSAVRGDAPMPDSFRWRTDLLTRGYAGCDRLIAPSYAFMQTTAALYGAVPQAVHNGRAAPHAAPATTRKPGGPDLRTSVGRGQECPHARPGRWTHARSDPRRRGLEGARRADGRLRPPSVPEPAGFGGAGRAAGAVGGVRLAVALRTVRPRRA